MAEKTLIITSVGTKFTPLAPSLLPSLPAHSPHSQLTPLAPSSLPLLPAHSPCSPSSPEHPWVPGTFLWSQEATSLFPCSQLTPLASPHPLSIPGSLEPSWDLRKPQLTPLTPFCPGSLEPSWGLRKPPACYPCP